MVLFVYAVILLPAHLATFAHKFYYSESPDASVLQTCHLIECFGLISLQLGLIDIGNSESQDP